MSQNTDTSAKLFPEGDDLQDFIKRRKLNGNVWRIIFLASTIVGIIALAALLFNIIDSSFGYVVIQNKVDPASLILGVEKANMLTAPNTVSSEVDSELVNGIKDNPNAIGFFGYAYYHDNQDDLRLVAVDNILPSAETAASGNYPYVRPLYIYTSADAMQSQPQVAGFVNYYLTNINQTLDNAGYFPADAEAFEQAKQTWLFANAQEREISLPPVDPAIYGEEASLNIAGSSTVYPVSREVAKNFRKSGFTGPIKLDQIGTGAGFELFCSGQADIANASRPIKRAELEACQKNKREPLEFEIATDALAIVVSQSNDFLESATPAELAQLFTEAETWAEVNPAWPDTPIERFIPGADSGTLDFFAEETFNLELANLPEEDLISILEANLSPGLIRRYNSEQPLLERSQENLYQLVIERVVEPRVAKSWTLSESLLNKDEIVAFAEDTPQGMLEFRSWLHLDFITNPQSSVPELAGIRTALIGTLWVILITLLVALPVGVGAAVYLEEYAAAVKHPFMRRFNGFIQTNINNLAGVPSIIYGMLGLTIFVRALEPLTSGAMFGAVDPTTANGRTILSASLTLALLILPLIIINAQEAIRAVPQSLRMAGMGLGSTKWQTIWHHVLPNALPGILTGNILAMSRAIGETAPLVVIGASTFIVVDPNGPFAKFTTLPIQIYQWTARPQDEFRNIAAAAIIVLLIMLLALNTAAVLLRNRYSRRLT